MRLAASLFFVSAACGRLQFADLDAPNGGDTGNVDAAPPTGPFGTATVIAELSGTGTDDDPSATGDLLELYFASDRLGAAGGFADIFVSKRATTSDPWGAPAPVTELNTTVEDQAPGVSADGLTIYFSSRRPAGGTSDIWMATRASRTDVWSTLIQVSELSTAIDEFEPQATPDDLHLVAYRDVAGNRELFEWSRASKTASWGTPTAMSVNSADVERSPWLSPNTLELWFGSDRNNSGSGLCDIFHATRATPTSPFDTPIAASELATNDDDDDPWISPDGHTIIFTSRRTGDYEIYEAHR